jgi:hypothetical protein
MLARHGSDLKPEQLDRILRDNVRELYDLPIH